MSAIEGRTGRFGCVVGKGARARHRHGLYGPLRASPACCAGRAGVGCTSAPGYHLA